jgi:hypothetical protein
VFHNLLNLARLLEKLGRLREAVQLDQQVSTRCKIPIAVMLGSFEGVQ